MAITATNHSLLHADFLSYLPKMFQQTFGIFFDTVDIYHTEEPINR